jgi:hypothetical protein
MERAMSEFDERIKSFQKSRDYVRDFFVFGFKSRNDFNEKSSRTYDNERRRLESWLGDYVRKDYVKKDSAEKDRVEKDCVKKGNKGAKKEKVANISLDIDSNMLDTNPLFKVYKAKSFTDNDIVLHFMILSLLQHSDEGEGFTAEEITEFLNEKYGKVFEQQTVRRKCNAYLQEGLLASRKSGNKLKYYCDLSLYEAIKNIQGLADALKLFQFTDSLGIAASELLDCMDEENDVFRIKHSFFVFTLDDEVLLKIFHAINQRGLEFRKENLYPVSPDFAQVINTTEFTKAGGTGSVAGAPGVAAGDDFYEHYVSRESKYLVMGRS